jgi:hypothetical protein
MKVKEKMNEGCSIDERRSRDEDRRALKNIVV